MEKTVEPSTSFQFSIDKPYDGLALFILAVFCFGSVLASNFGIFETQDDQG